MQYSDKSDRWVYPELYYNKDVTGSDGTTFNIISQRFRSHSIPMTIPIARIIAVHVCHVQWTET